MHKHRWSWMVLEAHYSQERVADRHARQQGYESYLPLTLDAPVGGKKAVVCLFGPYLFVRRVDEWSPLASTRGVKRVIVNCDEPSIISNTFIKFLRSREDRRGLIDLSPRLTRGDRVVFNMAGGLRGHVGIYQEQAREDKIKVLFSLFNKDVLVEVDKNEVVLAA